MCKLGIVVGAAPIVSEREYLYDLCRRDDVYVVAADGGIEILQQKKIIPNEWVGDMDSVSCDISESIAEINAKKTKVIQVSPIKDYTDMELALERVFAAGCESAMIFGGSGGARVEHTIANIQLLHKYALKGRRITLVWDNHEIFAIHNEKVTFPVEERGYVSVFSLSDISRNVSINGLAYEYKGNISNDNPIGVSNEFCGKNSSISVEDGTLLIMK